MVLYILGFIVTASLLTLFNYTGYVYLIVATIVGLAWLGLCLKGFKSDNDQLWGMHMFRLSLLIIATICFTIPFDIV
jgi:heme o synthase